MMFDQVLLLFCPLNNTRLKFEFDLFLATDRDQKLIFGITIFLAMHYKQNNQRVLPLTYSELFSFRYVL